MTKDEAMKLALEAGMTGIKVDQAITALHQALDHVPRNMIEPDMGIDRGAWDDVPDATRWVDELRGGDETEQEPVAFVCRGKLSTIRHCEECEPLYTAPPKREWVDLTEEQIFEIWFKSPPETEDRFAFVKAVIAELKEKNA